jgi:hypothetical protein
VNELALAYIALVDPPGFLHPALVYARLVVEEQSPEPSLHDPLTYDQPCIALILFTTAAHPVPELELELDELDPELEPELTGPVVWVVSQSKDHQEPTCLYPRAVRMPPIKSQEQRNKTNPERARMMACFAFSIRDLLPPDIIYITPATTMNTIVTVNSISARYLKILSKPIMRWQRVHPAVFPQGTIPPGSSWARIF